MSLTSEKRRLYLKEYRKKNKERRNLYNKEWYHKNIEHSRAWRRATYQNNEEAKNIRNHRSKLWRENNKDKQIDLNRRWRENNKDRMYLVQKEWREKNKEHINNRKLARKEMLASRVRPPVCECCGNAPNKSNKRVKNLCFDHDHKTGKFRGWLCHRCNVVIGQSEDSKNILQMMIFYLEKYGDCS